MKETTSRVAATAIVITIFGCLALLSVALLISSGRPEYREFVKDPITAPSYSNLVVPPYTPPPSQLLIETTPGKVKSGGWTAIYGNGVHWRGERPILDGDRKETWPAIGAEDTSWETDVVRPWDYAPEDYADSRPRLYLACSEHEGKLHPQLIVADGHYARRLDYWRRHDGAPRTLGQLSVPLSAWAGEHGETLVTVKTGRNGFISRQLVFQEIVVSEWERRWIYPADPTAHNHLLDILLATEYPVAIDLDGLVITFKTEGFRELQGHVLEVCPYKRVENGPQGGGYQVEQ